MTRMEIHRMQHVTVSDHAREADSLHGANHCQNENQQWENDQVASRDATSTPSTEASPLSPPPVYLHRHSPSNRSLYERPVSFSSTPSIASVPRSVASLPPYAAPTPPPPPPPAVYLAYNSSNNATTAPPPAGPAAPLAPQGNRNAFRLTYIRPWRRPELVASTIIFMALLIVAWVFYVRIL